MDEQSTLEFVLVRTVVQQLLDVLVHSLDRNASVEANLKLPAVGVISGADDKTRIANRGDGASDILASRSGRTSRGNRAIRHGA